MNSQLTLEEWARGSTSLHTVSSVLKLLCLAVVLLTVTVPGPGALTRILAGFALIILGIRISKVPAGKLFIRAALILPLSLTVAIASALSGSAVAAGLLLLRAYVSALSVLLIVATTSFPELLNALRRLGMPRYLAETVHLTYRYLLLLVEEAGRMTRAAASRGGRRSWAAAAGALTVLFASSYRKAESIHHAMLARGYNGTIPFRSFRVPSPLHDRATAAIVLTWAAAAWGLAEFL